MQINNNLFSLRDYIGYVFPGLIFLSSYFIYSPEIWKFVKSNNLVASLVFLVVSYYIGYASNILSSRSIINLVKLTLGDPYDNYLSSRVKGAFKFKLQSLLKEKWGEEIANDDSIYNLMFLCWRDIQRTEHQGLSYQFRLVSLWTFCNASLVPFIFLSIVLFCKEYFAYSIMCLFVFALLLNSWYKLRVEFAHNVYRIWYVLNKT